MPKTTGTYLNSIFDILNNIKKNDRGSLLSVLEIFSLIVARERAVKIGLSEPMNCGRFEVSVPISGVYLEEICSMISKILEEETSGQESDKETGAAS